MGGYNACVCQTVTIETHLSMSDRQGFKKHVCLCTIQHMNAVPVYLV